MVTLVKPLQPRNAMSPIEVTELGMVTFVRPEQPLNALFVIPLVPSFRTILVPLGIVPLYLYATGPA